ncbi:glycosyl hydrolase family 18 protein [Pseudoalteromonas pernae]|uniref:glycosyl hydrolase family 18 protein n=1 Tax=Pseudoalteromonas pernae TaxID=3118054 RepID=UPI003242A45B
MKLTQLTAAIALACASGSALSAPSTPSISWEPQEYSFVEVDLEGTGGYHALVQRQDVVNIEIKWNAYSGDGADSYKVYFDDQLVNEGSVGAGVMGGTISFPYEQAGRHNLYVELCEGQVCARSDAKPIVIADTDGAHLAPLPMDYDPNNGDYGIKDGMVTGAYFVEWGIYGRDFDVTNIPAHNLSHILYGFIPICGPNDSLTGGPKQALDKACQGAQDFEVVVHDPWAAFQKALPGVDANDPIRGTYAQMMALKQRYPDLKIVPSVGGWTLSDPFYSFTDKANRDTFVASMKEFLKTWKFYDGVDIDWEYPGGDGANPSLGDPANDGAAYVALMQELRAMLDELEAETGREYELTSAIGAGADKIQDVDYSQAVQYMDYIFAMTYDFYGAWNNITGHQTAIYCGEHFRPGQCDGTGVDEDGQPYKGPAYTIDNAINLLLAQNVPSQKIVVGAAMYGRGWEGVYPQNATVADNPMTAPGNGKLKGSTTEGVWEDGVIDYKGVKANMLGADFQGVNGFEVGYDAQAKAAWVWNRASGKLITLDTPKTVLEKGQYVRQHNLGGLFAWEIDADNGDILNAMHESLGDIANANKLPVVSVASSVTVQSGESVNVTATATDADNDPLTFNWQGDSALSLVNANSATVTVSAPSVTQDTSYSLRVAVSDGKDSVTKVLTVNVKADVVVGENNAPVVQAINDVSVTEEQSVNVSVSANDADNDPLTYSWDVPAGLTLSGDGASVSLTAAQVNQDTVYQVSVTVSDSQAQVTQTFNVTVLDSTTTTPGDTWDAAAIYVGGDTVIYGGLQYKAKWWSQDDQPDLGGPWELVSVPTDGGDLVWQSSASYVGGTIVTHNGTRYEAKWWTQGEEPGVADVWKAL